MDFDKVAAEWDTERRVKRARLIADEIAKTVHVGEKAAALEFGCGTGLVSFNLKDRFERISLLDTSAAMIEIARRKIERGAIANMDAFNLDIAGFSSLGLKYSVIYTSMALHHIVDVRSTVRDLYGNLRDGGWLCIVDLDEDDGSFHKAEKDFVGHNGFDQADLGKILESVGFGAIESHSFYRDETIVEGKPVEYSLFILSGRKGTDARSRGVESGPGPSEGR
jgi:ubiquinone/menaquinone biosynthesis C-methylase UbiE